MIYDGPRDSFVANAKLALKLADTDLKLWADLTPSEYPVARSAGKVQQISASITKPSRNALFQTPYRRNVTFLQTPPSGTTERKPQAPPAAARLFLRRSLHGFKKHECVACQRMVTEVDSLKTPCGHIYDITCLLSLVKASIEDEGLFPPRCCRQTLPTAIFERYMDTELSTLFASKTLEFSTPRRVYCAKITCSSFLGPRNKDRGPFHAYECSSCATRTCSRCRCEAKKHVLHACRPDEVPRRLLQRGWAQQCPGCDRLVELHSGCFHMTCLCKTQFCYRCGSKWKTCKCPLFENSHRVAGYNVPAIAPILLPLLPRDPTDDCQRHTWVLVQSPQDPEPLPKRRIRSSAPAQLESYIPARESILLRGVQAQERRSKSKEDRRRGLRQTPPHSPVKIDPERLDILERSVDHLISMVQSYPCHHDWRASPRLRDLCPCSQKADYSCACCAAIACLGCRSDVSN